MELWLTRIASVQRAIGQFKFAIDCNFSRGPNCCRVGDSGAGGWPSDLISSSRKRLPLAGGHPRLGRDRAWLPVLVDILNRYLRTLHGEQNERTDSVNLTVGSGIHAGEGSATFLGLYLAFRGTLTSARFSRDFRDLIASVSKTQEARSCDLGMTVTSVGKTEQQRVEF
jgi:hypothetical protein